MEQESFNEALAGLLETEKNFLMQTYRRQPVLFTRGKGCFLYDGSGKRYLDLVSGVAVNALGHSHPAWIKALTSQARKLAHISNHFYNEPMIRLASELCTLSGMERTFFCNSGTEANEAGLKIARKWGRITRGEKCYRIVSFPGAFHGRTMGALSVTSTEKYREPFNPLLPGIIHASWDELRNFETLLDDTVCAVIFETIQGESGVKPVDLNLVKKICDFCSAHGVLTICDEVQTGIGRTGKWFSFQDAGFMPDIITLAKGLGGGFPIGACLARGKAANVLEAGNHGSTYAGSPLACSAALSVIETIKGENILAAVKETGLYFLEALNGVCAEFPGLLHHARGKGLMIGLEFRKPLAKEVVAEALKKGLLVNATDESTLRFIPPLIITKKEINRALAVLKKIFKVLAD